MSCPYTFAQNGKAERVIRTTNNTVRSLLFHASVPPTFWVAALNMVTHLLNILPVFFHPTLRSLWHAAIL
jgi:hypothetical protein